MHSRTKRPRGFGGVFQRGRLWWICYQAADGKQVREPGGLDGRGARTKEEAEAKVKKRMGEIDADRYVGPAGEKITVDEMLDGYLKDLKIRGAKGCAQVRSHIGPLRRAFGKSKAASVKTAHLREFIDGRLETGSAPATVNRGLQALRAAFRLLLKEERLTRVPYFPMLPENNARTGFFEYAEHVAIKAEMPDAPKPHRDIAEFGYQSGWRRGEIEPLPWVHVDRAAGEIRLPDSKNGDPRTIPLRDDDGDLTDLGRVVERRWLMRGYGDGKVSEYVFHVDGHKVWDFGRVWKAAAVAAGFPDRLFHDYRRTAARDLRRSGVSEEVAMKMTGHRTAAVFRRYNITCDADKRDAQAKMRAYRKSQLNHSAGAGAA